MIGRPPKVPYAQRLAEFEEMISSARMGMSYSLAGYARKCHVSIDELILLCWKHKLWVRQVEDGPMKQARAYVTVDTVLFRRGENKT